MMPCNDMSQNTQYSLNRIYMILLGNISRVHDPWGTREVHIPTRTISTCLCGRSQRTIIISTIFARTVSTCPNYNLNISPSPARTISTFPTYTQSHVYARAQYYFNIGDDDASQSINMNIIHNHLNNHNYTGEINKTQSHKEFKSIIYQLMPICFGILKFQSTFYNSTFPFYNTGTRTNARHTIDTRPPSFPLTPCLFSFF